MKRFYTLFVIAVIVFAIIFFVKRPDILNEVWLWIIGLAGSIVEVFRRIFSFLKKEEDGAGQQSAITPVLPLTNSSKPPELQELATDNFNGVSITVLRYSDDGTTTIGLLYLNGFFYCYTLEDTHREIKIAGQTRIPAGKYPIDFIRHETDLTLKYRRLFPEWFQFHLEIKNVPNYIGVYIHSGGDHTHTAGCLLVSDSLSVKNEAKFLTNSKNTFRRLYTYLQTEIEKGTPIRLVVRDEAWFAKLNA